LCRYVSDVLDFSKMEAEKLQLESRPFLLESCIDISFEMQSIKANHKQLILNYYIAKDVPRQLLGRVGTFFLFLLSFLAFWLVLLSHTDTHTLFTLFCSQNTI
jgi:signal transduction histidine kinase